MGRYNFAAQKVHQHATQLLQLRRVNAPPPWYDTIATTPPSQRLVRPPMQRPQKAGKKASRMFKPVKLEYKEDELRWEYFNDHPWELARPRVMLENDGRDRERWDWSVPLDYSLRRPKVGQVDEFGRGVDEWDEVQDAQSMRPINGEAVVQRQIHLLEHTDLTPSAAYDQARKELYRFRHAQEVATRVAREEAMAQGAHFGPGPLEVGMQLEDRAYQDFRAWAAKEIMTQKQQQSSAYTGNESEELAVEGDGPSQAELQVAGDAVPASKGGQKARGGAALHP